MKELSLDNYKILQPWILKANWKEYNSNIITMLMWNNSYPTYFQIFENFALVCFGTKLTKHWFMPYCERKYLKQATDTLLELSNKDNIPLSIHSITQEYKDFLEDTYPNLVYFENHEVAEDYVYDRNQQETLSGKKMQKRRNHYNAFYKEYQDRYEYHAISKEDIPQIYELLEIWKRNKDPQDQVTIQKEEEGIHFLLEHFDELDLLGGCIYIDGILEAFSIASLISEDMIQIHIEKANKKFRGLYVAILKFLLATLDASVVYVNREDDMGLPYLQKAKHDMRPIFKIKKYLGVFDSVIIKHPDDQEINQMQDLWLFAFPDENIETTRFFFENTLEKERAYIIRNSTEVMGMVYVDDWKMQIDTTLKDVSFIRGMAIDEDYQKCGLMKKLMNHLLQEKKQYALQAYNWDIYRSFGFQESHSLKEVILDKEAYTRIVPLFEECKDASILQKIYEDYTSNKNGYRLHDQSYYEDYYLPYTKVCEYQILTYKESAYLCIEKSEDAYLIHELYYQSEDVLDTILSMLSLYDKEVHILCDINTNIVGTSQTLTSLMMYPPIQKKNLFINEIL